MSENIGQDVLFGKKTFVRNFQACVMIKTHPYLRNSSHYVGKMN